MRYAYDLDGTIAITRNAVIAAYERVGIIPPEDFFGKTWKEWLPALCNYDMNTAIAVHEEKNKVYVDTIRAVGVESTPIADIARTMGGLILTGASHEAARAITEHLNLTHLPILCEMTVDKKVSVLNSLEPGLMFEDTRHVADEIKRRTRWNVCLLF